MSRSKYAPDNNTNHGVSGFGHKPGGRAAERRQNRPAWRKERRRLMRHVGLSRRQARKVMHA